MILQSKHVVERPQDRQSFHFHATNLGHNIPAEVWTTFNFAIVTYDLTAVQSGSLCNDAFALAQTLVQQQGGSFNNICVAGIKLDQIPQTPLDMAARVYEGARTLALRSTSLLLFPVSCVTGVGLSELALYVGKDPCTPSTEREPY